MTSTQPGRWTRGEGEDRTVLVRHAVSMTFKWGSSLEGPEQMLMVDETREASNPPGQRFPKETSDVMTQTEHEPERRCKFDKFHVC